jgi:murein L,D-transpeptidase YcbB/YkuD
MLRFLRIMTDDLNRIFEEEHPHEFILALQKEYGLEQDGLVGPKTSQAMLEFVKKRERDKKIEKLLNDETESGSGSSIS